MPKPPKMGRPKIANPKKHLFCVRIDDATLKLVTAYGRGKLTDEVRVFMARKVKKK